MCIRNFSLAVLLILVLIAPLTRPYALAGSGKQFETGILEQTPAPQRYVVKGSKIMDVKKQVPLFFRGIGYSPYLPHETPLKGEPPGNDDRYKKHFALMKDMNVNYLHVFPTKMPEKFFKELDKTDMLYGQDIWIWAYEEDFLFEPFLAKTMEDIKAAIDHVYKNGRPDRLVLFSIGDELQADSVVRTDTRHPGVKSFKGRHLSVENRTPTEIALARLIDGAMEYELTRYGQRHLYCHTSFTHIGPLGNRPDLEVPEENMIHPDLGDLICLNIYTYAKGVRTSRPGSVTGTPYQGYLEELAAKVHKPVFITQVGLSTSPFEPKPWVPGFGGHKIEDVPKAFEDIWRDIQTAKGKEKICGVSFFEFNDEWWKSGEDPADSFRHEIEDPEEWFGFFEVGKDRSLIPKGQIPKTIQKLYGSP